MKWYNGYEQVAGCEFRNKETDNASLVMGAKVKVTKVKGQGRRSRSRPLLERDFYFCQTL